MNNFEEQLREIAPDERKVLQYLSVNWESISLTDFITLLRVFEVKTPEGKAYTNQNAPLLRKSLVRKGVIKESISSSKTTIEISDTNLREFLTREALSENRFEEVVNKIQATFNLSEYSGWYSYQDRYKTRLLRDYRLAIYRQDLVEVVKLFRKIKEAKLENSSVGIVIQIFSNPFQKKFLAGFVQDFQTDILETLLDQAVEHSEPTAELLDFARDNKLSDSSEAIKTFEVLEMIFKGEIHKAKQLVGIPNTTNKFFSLSMIALLEKDYEAAQKYGEEAIKVWRKVANKKKGFPHIWQIFFYGVALYKNDETKFYAFVEDFYSFAEKNYYSSPAHNALRALELFLKNNDDGAKALVNRIKTNSFGSKLVGSIISAIIPLTNLPSYAREFATRNRVLGYRWLELELNHLLSLKEKSNGSQANQAKEISEKLKAELGFEPIGNLIPQLEAWERALNVLTIIADTIQRKPDEKKASINETRVAWQLDFEYRHIQPVEQKYGKTGWSNGRNIALKRLYEKDVKNLTEQDVSVVKASLHRERTYYYGSDQYDFNWSQAITELVGHPYLFLQKNPAINVQLNVGEPALVIKQINDGLELSFDTKFSAEGSVIQKETETRYKVLKITKQHVDIANLFQNQKLKIPSKGREALMKAVQSLSANIAIQSDLEEHFENLPSVESDNRIHALVTPRGEGFHLEFFVKPFGTVPPYFKPGKGNESVIADLNGTRTRAKRNLKSEREAVKEIEESCPFLAEFESLNYEWELSDAEACLTALTEMEAPRKDGRLVIEWTKGQKLKLLGNINFENFSISVKGKNSWFEVTGEAKVNEDLVLSMRELTRLLNQNKGNFIELSDGQFIAITEKLRKHLQSLDSILDDKNRLHNLRAGILDDLSQELDHFKTDKAWKAHIAKLKEAQNFTPELPATFEAELRPYQTDGYNWLSRLANWGVGACLADDMGLGKTIQALAVLTERAEKGAALVVAPVSVCRNWVKEAARFAPTLNFQIFGSGDRKEVVESLGNYDVLVTSYNLLQSEEELFTSRRFATILLDEAQAIKNRQTKRSKAVMSLQGDFRLITTGTPIENHLGELWNLFNFLNPGLLGSHDSFNEKFAVSIEKNKDENTRKTLQRLIKPFVLRRRKNQVLDDLPAKTEIMLTVEMSQEERAFYEAVRREAIEKIEAEDGEIKDKRFRILAELTRLRLACCHPKLVNEDVPLSSSKLELFGEVLEELLDNKHKCLVFSQFIKHLRIVEEYLQSKGVAYHYLDGSTPPNVRQERIDEFQRGKGEIFLISLKAGGTGLNLTAADYVIHLDPWWNPAVEDQATDRVHRIGQQRPVTVYRLVTENTVEEKILKLHETKRDLADSLLDGTDTSGKLSAEDLLALIHET